ncbi:MAG TPA: HEAT repeat domain-containing protein [Steroidobacteraceae bacterium]|jgi:serine/threonine-protein kinase|nr:HEAT repeat domain-containing protein [Steroidobacteraceae bacterium]
MSFFTNLRADRLIEQIKSSTNLMGAETQKAIAKLKEAGPGAIDAVIAALPEADKHATVAFVDVLATLANAKSFPKYVQALVQGSPRSIAGVAWALTSSRGYPPNLLLDALATPGIAKSALLDVINGQRTRFSIRELLTAAYAQEPNEKAALFRIVAEAADESALPELISRLQGKDPIARLHIITVLARFNKPEVQRALQGQLGDNNKMIRSAALAALAKMDGPIEVAKVCALLRDPEIEVQNRAVEVLQRARDPETIRHLVPVLKDENEQSRRAAVEVLNEVGDARSVKYLLEAIKDDDWWVRSRAGDALGKIGGPKVIDAVLELVRDKDEDLRRAAIEILNQTKDERAINHLIEATKDADWWVSERAVDALAEIGSKRAVPRLYEMLRSANAKALPVVVRAIGKLGDEKSLDLLTPLLNREEKEIRVETIQALARLADEPRADQIRAQLQNQSVNPDATVARAAVRAMTELEVRFSSGVTVATAVSPAASTHPGRPTRPVEPARTLLIPERDVAKVVQQVANSSAPKLDINTLTPGDIIEGRYKYIERIGRGAFGTVLLMEDTVVDERLILKFLNPNVAQDEEIMKRFVHELRYSRKITHRNVIRIYDFLYIQGLYAISMEFFPSHTLGAEIVNEKPLELKRALQFGIDIATGMTVAHQVGIVHRDLKPANVLINDEGLLKIVDFGVAAAQREGDTQLTKTGYVIGSPKYMAPEQILGRKVDERADVYALGVMMYEMLTGIPPYSRGDHMAVMYQHVQGKARAPQEINPTLSANLAEVVVKAMAVDKAKRFQTMEEYRGALERFL